MRKYIQMFFVLCMFASANLCFSQVPGGKEQETKYYSFPLSQIVPRWFTIDEGPTMYEFDVVDQETGNNRPAYIEAVEGNGSSRIFRETGPFLVQGRERSWDKTKKRWVDPVSGSESFLLISNWGFAREQPTIPSYLQPTNSTQSNQNQNTNSNTNTNPGPKKPNSTPVK